MYVCARCGQDGRVHNGGSPTVALVLPGGGTRGAYEVGALSVLLPELEARGERATVYCGTSVGAINAVLLASLAHRPAAEQAQLAVDRWRTMRKDEVMAPLVGPHLPMTALRVLGDALDVPGLRLGSLLDASPLRKSLARWIDWLALHRNVRSGRVRAACVVATSLSHGGPVAFVEARRATPVPRESGEIRYMRGQLSDEHVRASAAIPLLFPPVEVTRPRSAWGHYIDGGTRLNNPIKPALALGAKRVVVIGFEPFAQGPDAVGPPEAPRFADVAANVVDGLLLDRVSADLHRLMAVNEFFAEASSSGPSPSARAYRVSRGREPYRRISYALVAPQERGEIGALADDVFERRYSGLRGLLRPDYPLISRLLGGRSRSRGELLSFLFFDEVFVEALIELGARDARRWLARHPNFWCSDRGHDFEVNVESAELAREERTLAEYRELRRR